MKLRSVTTVCLGFVALGGVCLWFALRPGKDSSRFQRLDSIGVTVAGTTNAGRGDAVAEGSVQGQANLDIFGERFDAAPWGRDRLLRLAQKIRDLPPAESAQRIERFIRSGLDKPTELRFGIGPNGALDSWPTLRVFLFEMLFEIDPESASKLASLVLAETRSADEWAVALRALASIERGRSTPVLQSKLEFLLQHTPWRDEASDAYLEAFDVASNAGRDSVQRLLAGLATQVTNRTVEYAAHLALDRMVTRDPVGAIDVMLKEPNLFPEGSRNRAQYLSRLDVTRAEHQEFFETYLTSGNFSRSELEAFAELFPNENVVVGNNLMTRSAPRAAADIRARDRESLEFINRCLSQTNYALVKPILKSIQRHLEGFLER